MKHACAHAPRTQQHEVVHVGGVTCAACTGSGARTCARAAPPEPPVTSAPESAKPWLSRTPAGDCRPTQAQPTWYTMECQTHDSHDERANHLRGLSANLLLNSLCFSYRQPGGTRDMALQLAKVQSVLLLVSHNGLMGPAEQYLP